MNLEQVANDVAVNFNTETQRALDPSMIPVIISIVKDVISLFKECRQSSSEAHESMKNPTLWQRVILNRTTRRELGIRKFRKEGNDLVNALIKTGGNYTAEQVQALYDA
jgi:hypothetical protein